MRKPLLLYEVLTDYTWEKHKAQQSNEVEMNEPQYILFMRHSFVKHEVLIVTYMAFRVD